MQSPRRFMWATPLRLFFLGFLVVLIGMVIVVISIVISGESTSGVAIIFVGPIPIIVGAGPPSLWTIAIATVLTILGIFLFVLWRRGMV